LRVSRDGYIRLPKELREMLGGGGAVIIALPNAGGIYIFNEKIDPDLVLQSLEVIRSDLNVRKYLKKKFRVMQE